MTFKEKLDQLTNLVEQMHLAHQMRDNKKFEEVHEQAAVLGLELTIDVEDWLDEDADLQTEKNS